METLILCIGLNKTGTTTVHTALKMLGYRSFHWGPPSLPRAQQEDPGNTLVRRAKDEGLPLLTYIPGYDAYSDIATLSANFDLADQQYPGSRFILTTRAVEAWLVSRKAHVERNRELAQQGRYSGRFLDINVEGWRRSFARHERRVREYFEGRSDLLILDVTRGEGWEVLCPFLGHPVPKTPFPWANRAPSRSRG